MKLVLAVLIAAAAGARATGQTDREGQAPDGATAARSASAGFRYEPGRIPAGRVHRYRKSNLDGSNPSEIALYLASETELQSLKWHPGEPGATLVVAEMDWEVASVRGLRTYRVDEHGDRSLAAELATSSDRTQLVARIGGQELACALDRFPWHSYDFDFASLNVALRFLVDPAGSVELAIVDPAHGPAGPGLAAKGPVELAYQGTEERAGLDCRRYTIDGPGLEDRGGSLWAAHGDEVFLVAFEIDLPDEPGMSSGKLEWLRNETRSAGEWEELVASREARDARR